MGYGIDTTINVTCIQANRGRFEARVEVLFEDTDSKERFVIVRPVLVVIGNVEEHRALQPVMPYIAPRRPAEQRHVAEVEQGIVSLSYRKRVMLRSITLSLSAGPAFRDVYPMEIASPVLQDPRASS